MTLRFEQILAGGVGECSYRLGDDAAHVYAGVDPRPDVEIYLETARRFGLAITYAFETQIHADFLSGARELVDHLGGQAELCVSTEGGARYGFGHKPVRDGNDHTAGGMRMKARFTLGHTPYLPFDGNKDTPRAVLPDDAFLVDSVGRPDLLGSGPIDHPVAA